MGQTIRFQHPAAPDGYYSMYVSDESFTAVLISRAEALGYVFVDVTPPTARWIPQRSDRQSSARR